MKKLSLTVLSVICAICMAFGIMLMTNVNTASADPAVTLSATKIKTSTAKDKLLLVTAIKNFEDVYEVGYTFTGEVNTISALNNKYYSEISTGTKTWDAEDIFGDGYAGAGLIIWEIEYSPASAYTYQAYAKYGTRDGANLIKNDPETQITATERTTGVEQYTVTVDMDGGALSDGVNDDITELTVPYGTQASALAAYTATKAGCEFSKWQYFNGENYVDLPADATVTTDITIKAVWITIVEIANANDFMTNLAADPAGYYKLTADVDLSETELTSRSDVADNMGNDTPSAGITYTYLDTFSGVLDGNGHKITLANSTLYTELKSIKGLFNEIESGAVIKNVNFDIDMILHASNGGAGYQNYNAALANVNSGTIKDCFISATLNVQFYKAKTADETRTHIIACNKGQIKDTLIEFNLYGGVSGTSAHGTRCVIMGSPFGSETSTVLYDNVIVVSATQEDIFAGFSYANNQIRGTNSPNAKAYIFSNYTYLMAGLGKKFVQYTENGVETDDEPFENLCALFTAENGQIKFNNVQIGAYSVLEKISTANDFMTKLADNPTGDYLLTADIDLTNADMTQYVDLSSWKDNYGYSANNQLSKGYVYSYLDSFGGTLNGQGHKIILNNKKDASAIVNATRDNIKGLFNKIASGAVISNVYFDIDMYGYLLRSAISYQSYNSLIAGINCGTIINCYVDAKMTVFGHSNYGGEFDAQQLGSYIIGDQQGVVRDTLINYNFYLTRATNFTSPTLLEMRAAFANFPGTAASAVYENVIIVSASQTDYFGTYRYANGFRYLNQGTVTNCYMYDSFANLIAASGKSCATGAEQGTAAAVNAFANLTDGLWSSETVADVTTLYYNGIALNTVN